MRRRRWAGCIWSGILIIFGLACEVEGAMTLSLSLSGSERFDDNFFFTKKDREADLAHIISPELQLNYEGRTLLLTLGYRGTGEIHPSHPEANLYNQSASLELNIREFRGLDIRLTDAYIYTSELPAFSFGDQPEETNEGIQVPRTKTVRNRAGMSVNYTWTPKVSTSLSYTNLITGYKNSDFQEPVVHDANLQIGYKWSSTTQWSFSYGIGITDYQGDKDIFADVLIHRLTIGLGHQFSSNLSANSNIGIAREKLTFPRDEKSNQPTFDLSLSRRYSTGSITLGYTRGVGTGSGLTPTATLSQRAFLRTTESIDRDISAFAQIGFGRNQTTPSVTGLDLFTFSYQADAGISMMILSWFSGSISYSYSFQQSQGAIGNTGERNLISLTLTARTPARKVWQ